VLDDYRKELLFFPPEFIPAVAHPIVVDRGADAIHHILVHSLYQYLHFTTTLEHVAVLPITASISMGRSGLDLPAGMRSDAFKITTDEAWHGQFCHDFIMDIARVTHIDASAVVEPVMIRRREEVRQTFEPVTRHLVDIVFAAVSETLISGLLSEIPRDRRLPRAVRDLVADHAADEGRHHAYFRSLLYVLWPQLSREQQKLLGPCVPEFIRVFLNPDLDGVAAALRASGFSQPQIADIIAESYAPGAQCWNIQPAARAAVRSFADVGALADPATREAFAAANILPDQADDQPVQPMNASTTRGMRSTKVQPDPSFR
jgi:hypothetical protein